MEFGTVYGSSSSRNRSLSPSFLGQYRNNSRCHIPSDTNVSDETPHADPLPSQSVEIQGLDKLNEMREMVSCTDETQSSQYIQSIANCGILSKEDLIAFVDLIDSLPNISILDGNITSIRFSHNISKDTGNETNVVYVTTEAGDGEWTRVEYVLSVTDVSEKISEEKISTGENSLLTSSVSNPDGKLTLHTETREPHPSGEGTMIQWAGEADGIFTRIYYYTYNSGAVNTDNILSNIQISDISQ